MNAGFRKMHADRQGRAKARTGITMAQVRYIQALYREAQCAAYMGSAFSSWSFDVSHLDGYSRVQASALIERVLAAKANDWKDVAP